MYSILGFNIHHIICDGWSMRELTHDLAAAYHHLTTGSPHTLPPIEIQYTDFAAWQQDQLAKVTGWDCICGIPDVMLCSSTRK